MFIPTRAMREAAQGLLSPDIDRTPVLTWGFLSGLCRAEMLFQSGSFQKMAAFKARDASIVWSWKRVAF